MPSPYGSDHLWGAFEVIEGISQDVIITQGGTDTTFEADPGELLYAYLGTQVGLTSPAESLTIAYNYLNALVGGGSFTFAYSAPVNSPNSPVGGLAVTSPSAKTLRLDLMHESWRPLFGVLPSDFATTMGDGFVSPYSLGYQTVIPKHAQSKLRDEIHEQYRAGRGRRRTQVRYGTEVIRDLIYPETPAALVRATRAKEHDCWAAYAGLGSGDVNPTLQSVWDSWSKNHKGIIVHNDGLMSLDVGTHDFEIVHLGEDAMDRFSDMWTNIDPAGEFYDLNIPTVILRSFYEHD